MTYLLECRKCKSRNYRVKRTREKKGERLEVRKFCKYCNKHTVHVEIR